MIPSDRTLQVMAYNNIHQEVVVFLKDWAVFNRIMDVNANGVEEDHQRFVDLRDQYM